MTDGSAGRIRSTPMALGAGELAASAATAVVSKGQALNQSVFYVRLT